MLTLKPVDILFVIDNSGSMVDEIQSLKDNLAVFLQEMASSDNDFHVGIVSTDLECNVPEKSCPSFPGGTSASCCAINDAAPCEDRDLNSDGVLDFSQCDGGRLRGVTGAKRFFRRPDAGDEAAWLEEVGNSLDLLGCQGSSFEAGLETARRAIVCGDGASDACPDPAVAQLNQGFLRDEADLVLIFVTDEDDCSYVDAGRYQRPLNALEHGSRLCNPSECYAGYAGVGGFSCFGSPRADDVPVLDPTASFLDDIVAAKGGDPKSVRAAAVFAAVGDAGDPLGMAPLACFESPAGPSASCGCWSSSTSSLFCDVTASNGNGKETRTPANSGEYTCAGTVTALQGGCDAMPGHRYHSFLTDLSQRRIAAGARSDTLVDSICASAYDETLFRIVNTVILTSCFSLGEDPQSRDNLQVRYNGEILEAVDPGAGRPGWSWLQGESQICLEGGLRKELGDVFEIVVLNPAETDGEG